MDGEYLYHRWHQHMHNHQAVTQEGGGDSQVESWFVMTDSYQTLVISRGVVITFGVVGNWKKNNGRRRQNGINEWFSIFSVSTDGNTHLIWTLRDEVKTRYAGLVRSGYYNTTGKFLSFNLHVKLPPANLGKRFGYVAVYTKDETKKDALIRILLYLSAWNFQGFQGYQFALPAGD